MADAPKDPQQADPDMIASRLLQRAHNLDGLPEIAVGLFFLMASGLSYAMATLPKGSLGFGIAVLSFSFGLPVLLFCTRPLVYWVRRRYLVQREGYVQYKPWDRKRRIRFVGIGLTAVVLMPIVNLALPPLGSWFVTLTGVLMGLLAVICGRMPRFVFAGVLAALAGVLIARIDMPLGLGMAALFGFQGVVTLVSGGVTLIRFFNPPPTGAESDECKYPATQRN
jgi:hypothetical protein